MITAMTTQYLQDLYEYNYKTSISSIVTTQSPSFNYRFTVMTRKRILKLHDVGELPELGLTMELLKGKGSTALMAASADLQEQTISLETTATTTEEMEEIQVDPSNTTEEVDQAVIGVGAIASE